MRWVGLGSLVRILRACLRLPCLHKDWIKLFLLSTAVVVEEEELEGLNVNEQIGGLGEARAELLQ